MAKLSKQAIIEYRELWKKEFEIDLSYEEAEAKALDLLELFACILKTSKQRDLQK